MKRIKNILLVAFAFLYFSVLAQENKYSTIKFYSPYHPLTKSVSYTVYLNGHMISGVGAGQVLEYKIHSTGHFSLIILIGSARITKDIDIAAGNTYYYKLDGAFAGSNGYGLAPEEAALKVINAEKNKTVVNQMEEDTKDPVGKITPSN